MYAAARIQSIVVWGWCFASCLVSNHSTTHTPVVLNMLYIIILLSFTDRFVFYIKSQYDISYLIFAIDYNYYRHRQGMLRSLLQEETTYTFSALERILIPP